MLQQITTVEVIESEDVRVEIPRTRVEVVTAEKQGPAGPTGPQGPMGPAGSPGATYSADFAWGDATPIVVMSVPLNYLIVAASVVIENEFDGAGAAITIGLTSDADVLMPADGNYPDTEGRYEHNPGVRATDGLIYLTIVPGAGATQGSGTIYVEAV